MSSGEAPDEQVIAGLLYCHEAECGCCDTGRLWRSAASLEVRDAVERAWRQLGSLALKERRKGLGDHCALPPSAAHAAGRGEGGAG